MKNYKHVSAMLRYHWIFLTSLLSLCAGVMSGCGGGDSGRSSNNLSNSSGTVLETVGPSNTVPVTVDAGPPNSKALNIPFVSVTVCRPGTSICQTVDHVMVDTGSYGLRLITPLNASLALPAVKSDSGAEISECGQFVSGYIWGAIVRADIKVGGELAPAQSIQAVGRNIDSVNGAPSECSSIGNNIGTVAALGANGIFGVGPFKEDCGQACVITAPSASYYTCSSGSCTATSMPLGKQLSNPIASFATNNNGLILSLPPVGVQGATDLSGTLIFGINTQTNNALSNVTVYPTDSLGHLTTEYQGTRFDSSFIDSGSNALYFSDPTISSCSLSSGFYCPNRALSLNASIVASDGTISPVIPFTVQNIDALRANIAAASVGGNSSNPEVFDWGLPFFFGRKVYMGIADGTKAPYWAF
jgi:hypothetical protein